MARIARMSSMSFSPYQREQLEELGADENTEVEILLEGKYGNKLVRLPGSYAQFLISW